MNRNRSLFRLLLSLLLSLAILVCWPSSGWTAKKKKKGYRVTATSAILMDSSSGKRLYQKDAGRKVLPASTTKVMTALLVLERLALDQWITVSKTATLVPPSKAGLKAGERYRVADLLSAVLISSANDASVVLAEAVAGSEERFVNLMNRRAKQLGASHTKFANSHGLPTKATQYTTAYDLYLIFRAAVKKTFFKNAIGYQYKIIRSATGRKIALKSHNTSIKKGWRRNVHGKTGYTRKAKACFVGYINKGRSTLIISVLGCTRRWDDVRYIIRKYGKIQL